MADIYDDQRLAVSVLAADNERLRARLAAVEALCDDFVDGHLTLWNLAERVRAAARGEERS